MYILVRLFSVCFMYFFFFKQKTAYEMRISDWSSDVCSSDLAAIAVIFDLVHPAIARGHGVDQGRQLRQLEGRRAVRSRPGAPLRRDGPVGLRHRRVEEIGRASCRERGGPDV